MLAAPAAAVAIAASWRIDYSGNNSGREAIYSVEVGRRAPLAVLSPDRPDVDYSSPVPSPDGRYLAFGDGTRELIARGDGSGARVLIPGSPGLPGQSPPTPVWSPDSTRLAWLGFGPHGEELHVARADRVGDRVVWRGPAAGYAVRWSRDGSRVRVASASIAGASPDGLWTVQYLGSGVPYGFAVARRGATQWAVTATGSGWTWSPDSRFLAYVSARGIAVLDMRGLRTRILTPDVGSQLTWSPDGTLLAYVDCCANSSLVGVGDIRTVTRSGTVRVVVPAATAGVVNGLAWAPSDGSATYRPAPTDLPGVYTTAPVARLAADGASVAYAACTVLAVWTPSNGRVVTGPNVACDAYASSRLYTLALAGDHVAYGVECCNNSRSWTLSVDVFGQAPQLLVSGGGEVCCTSYPVLAGRGSLVAYADRSGFPDYLWTVRTPGGQPLISFVQNRFVQVALDVDGDRVLVAHDGAVDVLLSENGGTVFHLDVPVGAAPDAQLDGAYVDVRDGTNVDVYAVNGGALLHTWPLPDRAKLLDAAHGLLAFTAAGEISVLRVTDGLRARVAPGTLAAFMDDGLATANGARVQVIPYSALPTFPSAW